MKALRFPTLFAAAFSLFASAAVQSRADFPFTLASYDSGEDKAEVKFLDLPLVTVFDYKRTGKDDYKTTFADVPFVTLFESESSEERGETEFLDVPLVTFFKTKHKGDTYDHQVLTLPILGSLYRNKQTEDKHKTTILYFIRIHRDLEPAKSDKQEKMDTESPGDKTRL